MDHVVYVDAASRDLDRLLNGSKTEIVRGATGRKIPYGRVLVGDVLYFINNDGSGCVLARAVVKGVINSEKLSPEQSTTLLDDHQPGLQLTPGQHRRWAGKRYLVLVEVEHTERVEPFDIDRSEYGNMDDWLPVADINRVRRAVHHQPG